MNQSKAIRILCVEDDRDTCELLQVAFKPLGFEIITVNTINEAEQKLKTNKYSLIILDEMLAYRSGIDLCREVRETDTNTPIVMYSADASSKTIEAAFEAGVTEFVAKPYWDKLLETVVRLTAPN